MDEQLWQQAPATSSPKTSRITKTMGGARASQWITFALASGACAAFNGVFAKLTTTELTGTWSAAISHAFGLHDSRVVEYLVRGVFLILNFLFNAIMWTLFTRALTLATSTTRVSIINTSANFLITAVLGRLIFTERLPPSWWAGAAMLVTGSVIIGRREEEQSDAGSGGEGLLGRSEDSTRGEEPEDDRYKDRTTAEAEDVSLVPLEPGESKLSSPEKK